MIIIDWIYLYYDNDDGGSDNDDDDDDDVSQETSYMQGKCLNLYAVSGLLLICFVVSY